MDPGGWVQRLLSEPLSLSPVCLASRGANTGQRNSLCGVRVSAWRLYVCIHTPVHASWLAMWADVPVGTAESTVASVCACGWEDGKGMFYMVKQDPTSRAEEEGERTGLADFFPSSLGPLNGVLSPFWGWVEAPILTAHWKQPVGLHFQGNLKSL